MEVNIPEKVFAVIIPLVFALNEDDNTDTKETSLDPSNDIELASKSPVIEKFLAISKLVAVVAVPDKFPTKLDAVIIPVGLLILLGSLSLLIVPVVILAPSAKLVAVVAVPVTSPTNVVAVKIPETALMPVELIVTADPTTRASTVEIPLDILIFDVIKSGSLASLIVPVVILAPSETPCTTI